MEDISRILEEVEKLDIDPHSGKLFAYFYETGDETLRKIALETLVRFYSKNILDFTVFRSAIYFERELVSFCKRLMHSEEGSAGVFTYGGTESIMLAVKSARDYFRKRKGASRTPEIIVPFTIHPSFLKSASYLGLKVRMAGIDANLKADVEGINSLVTQDTALIALSAPNWPYGTVDPVKDVAEIAQDAGTLLHVDACLGGFILPFFEKIGEKVEVYDFRVDGVTSISMDAHKYGYALKGASVLLFRNRELKKHAMFVNTSNPGYVFVNTAVLSSRSIGPLASAYAVMKYLGEEGYERLAKQVLSARNRIEKGLKRLGFESVGPVESQVLSMHNPDADLLGFMSAMRRKGWHFHLQRGVAEYSIPPNIHLTISPIHDDVAQEFISDAESAVLEKSPMNVEELFERMGRGELAEILQEFESGKLDSSIAPLLLEKLNEEMAEEIVKELVVRWYD
jgi:glutamate/tyrosine decarboxylase-like PLP-dependent enzyme